VKYTVELQETLVTMASETLEASVTSLVDDPRAPEGPNESVAWLQFVEECHATIGRLAHGSAAEAQATKALLAAAARLETRTARVLALTMLARVAGRLATGAGTMITSPATGNATTIATQADENITVPSINSRAASVLAYVDQHHSRSSCRLEEIAQTLRVSRSYLSRLVLRETGAPFNHHLQLARMNTAARLLQNSHLSIKEISSATGYEHVPSFDRQFKRHFHMTPGEFRRGVRI
jgi:AraC-like DNA-binding protein